MKITVTGAEWKRFYEDSEIWKDGSFHDDVSGVIDGKTVGSDDLDFDLSAIADSAVITEIDGVYFPDGDTVDGTSLATVFKKWRKAQTTATIIIECHISKKDAVEAAIIAAGGRTK